MPTGGSATTTYTARFLAPDMLERGRANTISCPIYSGGSLVEPASGTVSVYDEGNTAIVSAQAVTVTSKVATYAISALTLPDTLQLAERWRVEWTLVISGATYVFRNDAALVRMSLFPVVADADLFRRVSALNPVGTAPISSLTSFQDYLDEAWATIMLRLIGRGNRPNLIMSPSSLRQVHLTLTLHLIFADLATRLNEAYLAQADAYHDQYTKAWEDLRFDYDEDEDGQADSAGKRSAHPTIWLCGR